MEDHTVIGVLSQLASSKIKERSEGLDELTTLLKDRPHVIPTKALPQIAQSLLELLDSEYRAYCDLLKFFTESKRTKLRLVENRLSTVAYVLRLFIEKTSDRFKVKTLNLLLVIIPELMVQQESKTLLEPVAVHLSFAILALITSSTFKLKFTTHQWSTIMRRICSYFEERLQLSVSDRTVSIFLSILSELLSLDTTGIFNTSLDIHRCISNFFVFSFKETADTRLVLELSNKLIQATHLINITQTLSLIHECWRYMIKINFSSNEAVQREFLHFNLLASDLVDNKLPLMIGQPAHETQREEFHTTLREIILFMLENYDPNLIGSQDILCITTNGTTYQGNVNTINWFEFSDIRFNPSRDPIRWLELLSLVKLLVAYFSATQTVEMDIPLFKKRKISNNNARSILEDADSIVTFVINFLSNENGAKMRKLGLQIGTLYASFADISADYIDDVFESILSAFEDDNLIEWALLALVPIISQSTLKLDDSKATRIFKLVLPLIKAPVLCASSCVVLVQTISYSPKLVSDTTSINQIHDVCQLSEINGPFYLCEESFAFWKHIYHYSLELFPRDSKNVETKIIQWLSGKWSQLDSQFPNVIALGKFISWLCATPPREVNEPTVSGHTVQYPCFEFSVWKEKWNRWNAYGDQRLFLLQPRIYAKTIKSPGKYCTLAQATYQPNELNPLLYIILHNIQSDKVSDSTSRWNWIMLSFVVTSYLKHDDNLKGLISEFKSSLESSLSGIRFDDLVMVQVFLDGLHPLGSITGNRLSLRISPILQAIKYLKSVYRDQDSDVLTGEDFDISSPLTPKNRFGKTGKSHYHNITNWSDISNLCGILVEILLDKNIEGELDYSLTLFMDLISDLEGPLLYTCLDKFNLCASKNGLVFNEDFDSTLESITRTIGQKLLDSKHNTSNCSMKTLSSYLSAIKDRWICSPASVLNADSNDILNWILERLKDASFGGIEPLLSISWLLLDVLMSDDIQSSSAGKTKQEIFLYFKSCIEQLNPANISLLAPAVAKYMENISLGNEKIMFTELVSTLETPQKSLECSAFYSITLADISEASHPILVASLKDMLSYLNHEHTRFYVHQALERIKTHKHLDSLKELFDICRFDILNLWFSRPGTELSLLAEMFGFEDFASFFEKYYIEFGALYFATGSNSELVTKSFQSLGLNSERDILIKSYPICIPLAFVGENIGNLIFEVTAQLLRRSAKSYSRRLKFVTVRWVIKFMDFGHPVDLKEYITSLEGLEQPSTLAYLIDDSKQYAHYWFPLSIPFHIGRRLLESSLTLSTLASEPGSLKLLLLWGLSNLEEAKSNIEMIKCIRELKFLLIYFKDTLSASTIISEFCSRISFYLSISEVHDEVADIIVFLLQLSFAKRMDLADSFSSIFFHCIIYRNNTGQELKQSILDTLLLVNEWPNLHISNFWRYCVDFLRGFGVSNDIYDLDEILNGENCSNIVLSLFSLIVKDIDPPDRPFCDSSFSEEQINNLLRYVVERSYISDNFQLWKAHILRSYYLTHDLDKLHVGYRHSWFEISEEVVESKYPLGLLHMSFFRFLSSNIHVCSSKERFLLEVVTQHIISSQHSSDTPDELLPLELRQYYQIHSGGKVVVDGMIFETIFGPFDQLVEMGDNINGWFAQVSLPYSSWLLNLLALLMNIAQPYMPHLRYFLYVCRVLVSFAEDIFPYIVSVLLIHYPDVSMNIFPWLLSNIGELVQTAEFERKITVVLDILLVVRNNFRLGQKCSKNIYLQLDLKSLSEIALKANVVKFSYLLYEEYFMDIDTESDFQLLHDIYAGIEDIDFLSGLPPACSLSEARIMINEVEPDSWKRFVFFNAELDSQFHKSGTVSSSTFGHTLESNSFYGLASLLDSRPPRQVSNDTYRWALHLDQWDLPAPPMVSTVEKALYGALRRVRYGCGSISEILKGELLDVINSRPNFPHLDNWITTVSEIETMRFMADHFSTEYIPRVLENSLKLTQRKLRSVNFADYKAILQCHYLFFDSVIQNPDIKSPTNPELPYLSALCSLKTYIELAIGNDFPQDALRSAFLLKNLSESACGKDDLKDFEDITKHVVTFLSARTLWNFNTKTAIMMMQELLDGDKDEKASSYLAASTAQRFKNILGLSMDEVRSYLVEWLSKSKFETPLAIYNKYISNWTVTVENPEIRSTVFHTFGDFLNRQLKSLQQSGEIEERQTRYDSGIKERKSLKLICSNKRLPQEERKDAKRHLSRVEIQLLRDKNVLDNLISQRSCFLRDALLSYLNVLVLSNSFNSDVIDKFCGLWFEFDRDDSVNRLLLKEISSIPTWKFLPWVHQIASKLTLEDSEFQKPLKLTIKRLLYKLPYDSLYSVLSIKFYKRYSVDTSTLIARKVSAVEKLLEDMKAYDHGDYFKDFVVPIEEFCTMSIDLAALKPENNSRKLSMEGIPNSKYWSKQIVKQKIPFPTIDAKIQSSDEGRKPRAYILAVDSTIEITATGISLPKVVKFKLSDGTIRKLLMKGGNDDLRQDAIMEQVFTQVNNIIRENRELLSHGLTIRTYKVIPLGPKAGIIEFVASSTSLFQILSGLHQNDGISFDQARRMMKAAQTKSVEERLATYLKITSEIKPQLRNFFFDSFPDCDDWFNAKKVYTKGIAVTSIVGYILGLGDRHLNNILLDFSTGEPIHIDLGIAFDQGRLLPIPELVPFRLTRDIVDGFGVTKVDGLFRKSCERVYDLLRRESERVMCVLNILKWDPLYSWLMSPIARHKYLLEEDTDPTSGILSNAGLCNIEDADQNNESYRALKGVEEKLRCNGLSVEAKVQELIQEAISPENLAVIYMGWSPFY